MSQLVNIRCDNSEYKIKQQYAVKGMQFYQANKQVFFIILVYLDEFNKIEFTKKSETWPGIDRLLSSQSPEPLH